MNSKQAKSLRRVMAALGVTKDRPDLQLTMQLIDTGKKRFDEKDQAFKNVYRYELCNQYKRAFRQLAKDLKASLRR